MIIAVDFDGTIVEHRYPKIGKPIPFAIETLKKLQSERHTLILWTVREGELLQEAVDYCSSLGVTFYAHNTNFPEEKNGGASRKLTADVFIDDRNVGGLPDWAAIYHIIQRMRRGESFRPKFNLDELSGDSSEKKSIFSSIFKSKK